MYQIEITQEKLDFLKRINGKYAMDRAIAAIVETTDTLPVSLEIKEEQQFTNILEMLFDISKEDENTENREFAKKWSVEIYQPPSTLFR